jgi:tetratricopeptide (TPR) repeat protein
MDNLLGRLCIHAAVFLFLIQGSLAQNSLADAFIGGASRPAKSKSNGPGSVIRPSTPEAAVKDVLGVTGIDSFPDEQAAMDRLAAKPSPANRRALAEIRCNYAMVIGGEAEKTKSSPTWELAVQYAQTATELAPDVPKYWFVLGQVAMIDGNNLAVQTVAEEAYRKTIELDPGSKEARLGLGALYVEQERYNSALNEFEPVVGENPALVVPTMVSAMCLAYVLDQQWERGVAFFRSVLKSKPDADSARLALAILLHQQKKIPEATQVLDGVVQRRGADGANREYAARLKREWQKEGGAR